MFGIIPWRQKKQNEVTEFRREVDNLFDRFFGESLFPSTEFLRAGVWSPRVDVIDGKKEITVKAEIPGVEAKDIDVSLNRNMLTIKGEKKLEKEEKDEKYHRIERSCGSFTRTVDLPAEVDADAIDASYKKGILTIVLKKTKEAESKKIAVKPE
jgi:HSP20 family protein